MQTFQLGKIFKAQKFLILASMEQNIIVGKKKQHNLSGGNLAFFRNKIF